jgi:hypothetical protein
MNDEARISNAELMTKPCPIRALILPLFELENYFVIPPSEFVITPAISSCALN